ncbi:MAG: hypothetical protein NC321_05310 [Clostridium sp.]|nr:hypothetical protein [Clostridium sp.]
MHARLTASISLDKAYWNAVIHSYSSDYVKMVTDAKHDEGTEDYIVKVFRGYLKKHCM